MTWTYDPTTSRGQVRLLCTDTDAANQIFSDAEIDTFLTLEDSEVKGAAALALETIASQEALILKCLKVGDVTTDGAKLAKTLMDRASRLRADVDGVATFDWAEQTLTSFAAEQILWNDALRGG